MTTPKPPPTPVPGRSLNRQVVLDEDEYTAALSQIIARDFFPSLAHLDATNEYLDAVRSSDPHLINASVRRLQEINATPATRRGAPYQTPSQTPYGGGPSETPLRTPLGRGERPSKRPRFDADLSLDEFQARYTSEDNSSFTQILDDENRKRKEKWMWAWDAQKRVEGQRERIVEGREKMMIEAPDVVGVREKFSIEAPTPAGLITDGREQDDKSQLEEKDKSKKEEEASSDGMEVILKRNESKETSEADVMAPKKDTRSAGVDGWNFKARNSLMFSPDADVSPYHFHLTGPDTKIDPKVIKYGNTRLPEQDDNSSASRGMSAPPSPSRSRINAAISGVPYRPKSPTTSHFPLVPNIPSPTPSELGPAAVKQLMTWGTLNATPRLISKPDDPANSASLPTPSTPFHIPAPSSREVISHRLSNNASKSLREKAGLLGLGALGRTPGPSHTPGGVGNSIAGRKRSMAPPSWTPSRADAAGSLTPAARNLLHRSTLGTAATRRAEAMGRMAGWEGSGGDKERDLNKVRWTPTPSPATRR